jgi:hypothetical protein
LVRQKTLLIAQLLRCIFIPEDKDPTHIGELGPSNAIKARTHIELDQCG